MVLKLEYRKYEQIFWKCNKWMKKMCLWVFISLNQILSIENVDPIRPDKLCLSRQRKTERGASGLAAPHPVSTTNNLLPHSRGNSLPPSRLLISKIFHSNLKINSIANYNWWVTNASKTIFAWTISTSLANIRKVKALVEINAMSLTEQIDQHSTFGVLFLTK